MLKADYAKENIIMADPMAFWNGLANRATHGPGAVHTPEALQKYQIAFFNRDTVHAVSVFRLH